MLFVTTRCNHKSTSYIHLFNNCKEKWTFCTRPRILKTKCLKKNTRWNCNFSLPFKNLPLKLHLIQTPLQKLGRNNLHQVLNISYFSHFTSNISGQQCVGLEARVLKLLWPGKPALLLCQRNYHVGSFIYKNY